jgi:hypothetical protein
MLISKAGLEKHVQSVHEHKQPFQCKICKKSFAQIRGMKSHTIYVHGEKHPIAGKL